MSPVSLRHAALQPIRDDASARRRLGVVTRRAPECGRESSAALSDNGATGREDNRDKSVPFAGNTNQTNKQTNQPTNQRIKGVHIRRRWTRYV